ncbi:MAG: ferrochelatase [Chlorobiaceae bacterium]
MKIAVILAAHGEAETTRFMENYRVTSQTLAHASQVMPIPRMLQKTIAVTSSIKKLIRSRTNPECSPHNQITRDQVEALQHSLDASPSAELFDFKVHAAFSAAPPYVEQVIERTRLCDGQVIVSMSPIDNTLSCGQLCSCLAASRSPDELGKVKVLSRFWSDERLYSIYGDYLFNNSYQHYRAQSAEKDQSKLLLLLFHGTLVKDAKGDPPLFRTGREETMKFSERLQEVLQGDPRNPYGRIMTVYLNHNVGGEWTRPSFEEITAMLATESSLTVDLFGCGYFADGNETIHRVEALLHSSSVRAARSIPCLNCTPAFTDYLATRVTDAARQIMIWRCITKSCVIKLNG